MSAPQVLRVTVVQEKQLADASKLHTNTRLVNARYCRSIRLVGYHITGTAGTVPSHVLLHVKNLGTDSEYITVTDGIVPNAFQELTTSFVLYPPGGVTTQGRTFAKLGHKDGAQTLNFNTIQMELRAWDSTAASYLRWDDYTSCVLEFVVESFESANAVRSTIA